jgi:hypothetical protein
VRFHSLPIRRDTRCRLNGLVTMAKVGGISNYVSLPI